MDIKDISEQSYKNGYTKGYEQGKKEAVAKNTITTNYDRIRNMSVEEMAEVIYKQCDSICDNVCKAKGGCPYGDNIEPNNCKDCIKDWLNSEVQDNEYMV